MNKIFGITLTLLGISALLYTAFFFVTAAGSNHDVIRLLIYWTLGMLFFISGVRLRNAAVVLK